MQTIPSTSRPSAGANRWSSTGRGIGSSEGQRPAASSGGMFTYAGVAAPKHAAEVPRAGYRVQAAPAATNAGQPGGQALGVGPATRAGQAPRPGTRQEHQGRPPVAPGAPSQQPGLTKSMLPTTPAGARAHKGPASDTGTNADWWRPASSSSVVSYPMTAVRMGMGACHKAHRVAGWSGCEVCVVG